MSFILLSHSPSDMVRKILVQSIEKSGKSRKQVADEMTVALNRRVTENMLSGFTAASREDRKFPAEFVGSFCKATGDTSLLSWFATLSGLQVISAEDQLFLELGREIHARNLSDLRVADITERLKAVVGIPAPPAATRARVADHYFEAFSPADRAHINVNLMAQAFCVTRSKIFKVLRGEINAPKIRKALEAAVANAKQKAEASL